MQPMDDRREHYEERAAILEYDAGFTRREAEMRARSMVYGVAEPDEECRERRRAGAKVPPARKRF